MKSGSFFAGVRDTGVVGSFLLPEDFVVETLVQLVSLVTPLSDH